MPSEGEIRVLEDWGEEGEEWRTVPYSSLQMFLTQKRQRDGERKKCQFTQKHQFNMLTSTPNEKGQGSDNKKGGTSYALLGVTGIQ